MIKTVIIGFAHMHVNEVALYIDGQPDTTLVGIADVKPKMPEDTEKRYTRAWNLKNVAELSGATNRKKRSGRVPQRPEQIHRRLPPSGNRQSIS